MRASVVSNGKEDKWERWGTDDAHCIICGNHTDILLLEGGESNVFASSCQLVLSSPHTLAGGGGSRLHSPWQRRSRCLWNSSL